MSDFWTQWENQVIGGRLPLRRFLGESSHSAVFLTEYEAADAAIKFIRDDPSLADTQLERWRAAAALSHPHLIRLFESGRCRLGNHELLFVVMEYAEQTLAQILTLRALTFDEVRQMSGPALAALSFLHGNGWVHGEVKPTRSVSRGSLWPDRRILPRSKRRRKKAAAPRLPAISGASA
jgi:serine/threonine protein kinase